MPAVPAHRRSRLKRLKVALNPRRVKELTRLQQAIGAGLFVAIVAGGIAAGIVVPGGNTTLTGAPLRSHRHTSHTAISVPVVPAADRCPLTDLPAPGLKVPKRPALLVKVGNEPYGARPQSGLNEADIVYDTPAEGFIMRYIAVYQCDNAAMIGPDRSVRWVDYHIVPEFGDPILAFAGGINPNVDAVAANSSWLSGANLLDAQSGAAYRTSNRVPPDNLYTSTAALYRLFPGKTVPPPVFAFTRFLPSGAKPVADASLAFSGGTDVTWKWQQASHSWLHTYDGAPDIDELTNQPVTTINIVIEIVRYRIGPYSESTGGSGDIESQTTGTGLGYVLRGGRYLAVIWRRKNARASTTFATASGQVVGLAPGRTWVEIMTDSQAAGGITFTP